MIVQLLERSTMPVLEYPVCAACPEQWIGFGNKCFYFSDDTRNWTHSQAFCASLKSQLAQFETLEELVRNILDQVLCWILSSLIRVNCIGLKLISEEEFHPRQTLGTWDACWCLTFVGGIFSVWNHLRYLRYILSSNPHS